MARTVQNVLDEMKISEYVLRLPAYKDGELQKGGAIIALPPTPSGLKEFNPDDPRLRDTNYVFLTPDSLDHIRRVAGVPVATANAAGFASNLLEVDDSSSDQSLRNRAYNLLIASDAHINARMADQDLAELEAYILKSACILPILLLEELEVPENQTYCIENTAAAFINRLTVREGGRLSISEKTKLFTLGLTTGKLIQPLIGFGDDGIDGITPDKPSKQPAQHQASTGTKGNKGDCAAWPHSDSHPGTGGTGAAGNTGHAGARGGDGSNGSNGSDGATMILDVEDYSGVITFDYHGGKGGKGGNGGAGGDGGDGQQGGDGGEGGDKGGCDNKGSQGIGGKGGDGGQGGAGGKGGNGGNGGKGGFITIIYSNNPPSLVPDPPTGLSGGPGGVGGVGGIGGLGGAAGTGGNGSSPGVTGDPGKVGATGSAGATGNTGKPAMISILPRK